VLALTGLTLTLFMLFNKGYSPQFLVYLLPFIVLLFPTGRGLVYALIFTGLNVLEQPVYFVLLPQTTWLLTAIVSTRFLLTILLAVEFGLELWPVDDSPRLAVIRQNTTTALAWGAALALLMLIPLLGRAYTANRLNDSPAATLAGLMQAWADQTNPAQPPRLLLSEQAVYRQLYPPLHNRFDLRLTDGAAKFAGAPTLAELLANQPQVWTLPTGPAAAPLREAGSRGKSLATFEIAGLGPASLVSFERNPAPFIAPARFQGGVELLAHRVQVSPTAVDVTLYWRAVAAQNQSYTVFTQLLNSQGQLVAGHDSPPANGAAPTDTWAVNAVQADPHRIDLPAGLPPGDYTVVIGLYNRFNERLRGLDPDGFGFANRAMPLATVRLQ
jgi:hypothetical protein